MQGHLTHQVASQAELAAIGEGTTLEVKAWFSWQKDLVIAVHRVEPAGTFHAATWAHGIDQHGTWRQIYVSAPTA